MEKDSCGDTHACAIALSFPSHAEAILVVCRELLAAPGSVVVVQGAPPQSHVDTNKHLTIWSSTAVHSAVWRKMTVCSIFFRCGMVTCAALQLYITNQVVARTGSRHLTNFLRRHAKLIYSLAKSVIPLSAIGTLVQRVAQTPRLDALRTIFCQGCIPAPYPHGPPCQRMQSFRTTIR